MILIYVLVFTLIGSVASLAGTFFLLIKSNLTQTFSNQLVNFAAGVLIATAFLDLFPEAQAVAGDNNIFVPALLGFVIFFFSERFIQWFHKHHEHGERSSIMLILIGDAVHNFIDGVAITASFLTNIQLGITTSLAVAAHEIPQEIADMSILLSKGLSKSKALLYNFLSALTALGGALVAFYFSQFIEQNTYFFLSLTAGFFIYISASDLIPDIHEKYLENKKFSHASIFILGIATVFILAQLLEG